ncbi:S41 family peptidase [Winogradskyella sp.]|uniref:S41 family peptidase n=1 Tax=Winogradskyella sp. TaxID=1883156 RepID=UPI003AB6D2CB
MKSYCLLMTLCLSTTILFGQKLELKKASPFTAVKWQNGQALVQFENTWYHFEKLAHFSKKELLDFCKQQYGNKWQRRFSEDLVAVLQDMGFNPQQKVTIQLSTNGVLKTVTGTFLYQNRQQVRQYNAAVALAKLPQKISSAQAIEDLKQFKKILDARSAYAAVADFDYQAALKELTANLDRAKKDIDINVLTHKLSYIMSQLGDRHSSIKNAAFNSRRHPSYSLKLPFGIRFLAGKAVALKKQTTNMQYAYFDADFPYLKSIDGIAVATLLDNYNYRATKAPIAAKNTRGATAIENYGALLFKNNLPATERVHVVFSNGYQDKKLALALTTDAKGYTSKVLLDQLKNTQSVANNNFDGLTKLLAPNIGYLAIPQMYSYDKVVDFEDFIKKTFINFSKTRALIIDLRNNPGGVRDLLKTVASYIIPQAQSPWVANVAYLRTDTSLHTDEATMSARYLYSYSSKNLTAQDRAAIEQFSKSFKQQKTLDTAKFSSPYYMVLHSGKQQYTQPVYLLVNERSFSAATVFTSAFKGLPNVQIVGVNTDGSSGNSKEWTLKNTNIRVKVSTMLSFQRNGKTLDGNGTFPDLEIQADEAQLLNGVDSQLQKLIAMIDKMN